jgi:carbonic anhydrase
MHAESTARIMKENYQHITEAAPRLTATVEENVLVQLENLRTHPSVAAALARDELKLHGWVYKRVVRVMALSCEARGSEAQRPRESE